MNPQVKPSSVPSPWFRGDATALAEAIVGGALSAVEALERTLADIAAHDGALNAVCHVDAALGLREARALDAERAASSQPQELLATRPFFGVPLLLKDVGTSVAHRELPSRMGSRVWGPQGYAWPVDGELTRRYRAAGFVMFGRTTSPEMGMSASTEAVAYGGPTHNPWRSGISPGGSSGGAGAVVAAGLATIAHANDGAGSIRIPASACGLVGLKPSRGLMPLGPLAGEGWGGLVTDHVLSRTVRDCARALAATAGADAGAPYAAPELPIGFLQTLEMAPPRLRIGLVDSFFEGDPLHPDVHRVLHAFADVLRTLGHTVEPVTLDFTTRDVVEPVMRGVATGSALALDLAAQARGRPIAEGEVEPVVWSALAHAKTLRATDYLSAINALHRLGRSLGTFHERFDLLLTPTLAEPPPPHGRYAMNRPDFIDYRLGPTGLWRYTPFAPLANATGAPAISLPVGLSADGLPIGAMLAAVLGGDALLLQVAAQCEAAGAFVAPHTHLWNS